MNTKHNANTNVGAYCPYCVRLAQEAGHGQYAQGMAEERGGRGVKTWEVTRRRFLAQSMLGLPVLFGAQVRAQSAPDRNHRTRRPNIVFILADDLGYGDLGCFGQKDIRTPNLDRMAAEGTRFTQSYCGTSVCAPSRCALMTGLHMGHAPIRANREVKPEGQKPLPPGTFTVARLLKDAGYDTAAFGKWGLGFWGTSGDPNTLGFDLFFGYNCQKLAHNYYPEYLWRNNRKVPLDGKTYSHDLIASEALEWLGKRGDKPFFLYLPFTLPHPTYVVPDLGEYADKDWTDQEKTYAAMVSRLDRSVGQVLDQLKARGLDGDTLVIFASDNGPQGNNRFNSTGGLSGSKRGMMEGSLRTPTLTRWPGHVPAGRVCDEPWAFWDFLPTCAELAGAKVPPGVALDGLSVAAALEGGRMPPREYFYWELHEGPCKQAVRFGNWKALRNKPEHALMLFDLATDPQEKNSLAAKRPDLVAKAEELMRKARVDSPDWPLNAPTRKAGGAAE